MDIKGKFRWGSFIFCSPFRLFFDELELKLTLADKTGAVLVLVHFVRMEVLEEKHMS